MCPATIEPVTDRANHRAKQRTKPGYSVVVEAMAIDDNGVNLNPRREGN
jgi:hypothetical protein